MKLAPIKKLITDKQVFEGHLVPRFYGIAWRDHARQIAHCYPVPLNLLVRWAREFWFFMAFPKRKTALERAWFDGYEACRKREEPNG